MAWEEVLSGTEGGWGQFPGGANLSGPGTLGPGCRVVVVLISHASLLQIDRRPYAGWSPAGSPLPCGAQRRRTALRLECSKDGTSPQTLGGGGGAFF